MKTPAQLEREAREEEQRRSAQEESIRNATQKLLEATTNPLKTVPASDAKAKTPAPVVRETIHADDKVWQEIIKAYKDRYNKGPYKWYKEPEKNKALHFEDKKTATEFAEAQAKAGRKFIMIDESSGKVKGYSDGKDFHENTGNQTLDDIKIKLGGQNNGPRMR